MAKWSVEDLLGWILVPQRSLAKMADHPDQEVLEVVEEEEEVLKSQHQQEQLFRNLKDKK